MIKIKKAKNKNRTLTTYVYDYLNKRVLEGSFADGELPTENQLVDELKVSKTTVRLAQARLIAEKKIVKLQGKGTFVKGYAATDAARKNLYVVASPVFRIGKLEFWDAVYDGIIEALDYERYAMKLLIPPHELPKQEQYMLQERISSDNSAVIFLGDFAGLSHFIEERRSKLPMVRIGGILDTELVASVCTDPEAEMLLAVKYLYAHGHRRVAFLGGFAESVGCQIKARVLTEFAARHGLELPPEYIAYTDFISFEAHLSAAERLMRLPNRPTAIICVNDQVAEAVYVGIKREYRIPEDVSIVGCDATSALRRDPVLTTVDTKAKELGRRAFELISTADGDPNFWMRCERINPVLCEGRSCKKIVNAH